MALDLTKVIKFYAPISVMPAGSGGEAGHGVGIGCLCWPSGRAFD